MPPKTALHTDATSKGQPHPPDHSILKTSKKIVEFDPRLTPHDYEDAERKGHTKPEGHQKEEHEIDLSGDHGKFIFCRNLHHSLSPLSTLLKLIGRFPLSRKRGKDHKTYEYAASCATVSMLHFNITTIILYYALVAGLYTIIEFTLDLHVKSKNYTASYKTQMEYDRALIQRHSIPLVIVFTTLVQACITSILFAQKHAYLAHIFTFLEKATYTLHMDLADRTRDFSTQSTVKLVVVTCVFILLASFKFGPSIVGTSTVFGSLMVRVFLGFGSRTWLDPNNKLSLHLVQISGGIFLVLIFLSSIAPILLFIYKCKIVRNAFAFWNGRAYCALLRGTEYAQTEEARTTYNLLFKDHCVLLDLVESIDQMYSLTLESFFGLQVVSLIFQMYFFHRTGSQSIISVTTNTTLRYKSVHYTRPYDWLPAMIMLFTTAVIFVCAGKAAANVAEEAEAGMEVLRRKGVMGRRTDQELEFLYSMNYSFQAYKKIEISGAGYLYYNKAFIIQLFAVTLFCFLLLCQFRPYLEYKPSSNRGTNGSIARFLRIIEGPVGESNQSANPLDDREWALGY